MTALEAITGILARAIGLNVESIGTSPVETAIRRRASALGVREDEYPARVKSSPQELQSLIEEIVVGETWFFRDERPFRYLTTELLQTVRALRPGQPLRVLSVPCSSGEEPYSVAMTLMDGGLAPGSFRIDAVDINDRAIAQARKATYTNNAFRGKLAEGARERYFRKVGELYQLDPAVRQAVTFRRANILDPGFSPGEPAYEFVFCRNLLIYLDRASRQAVLRQVDRYLVPTGTLFLGHAETPDPDSPFRRADVTAFAYRREPPRTKSRPTMRAVGRRSMTPSPSRTAPPSKPLPASRRPTVPARTPAPAPVAEGPPPLSRAQELADAGKLAEAAEICEQRLEKVGPEAGAYCLLGIIHHAKGEWDRAEHLLSRALYLDKSNYEALVYLALLCDRRDDTASAEQYRRRAKNARGDR